MGRWIPTSPFRGGRRGASRACRRNGSAVVELTLLAPWILFLFVGIFDLGFYYYALIAVENASRLGAAYTAQSASFADNQAGACTRVLAELAALPNINPSSTCTSLPLVVTASSRQGVDGSPATEVSITYQGVSLIPIPGLLMGRLNVTRTTQMKVMP